MTAETSIETDAIGRGTSRSAAGIVARGGSWMIGARLLRTMVTILGMIVLARLLTPSDFGVVALTATVTVLSLVILEGAIDVPTVRRDDLTRDDVQSMIWTALLFLAPLAGALYVAAPAIETAMQFEHLAPALRGIIPIILLQVFFVTGSALLRRQHRFRSAAMASLGSVTVYMTLAVILAALGWGLWSIIIAQNISMLLTALFVAHQTRIGLRWPRRFSFAAVGPVGAYGAGSRILAWFWSSIDTIAVAATLGPAAAGLYTRAYNINIQLKEPFSALDGPTRQALITVRNRDGQVTAQAVIMLRLITIAVAGIAAVCAVLREPIVMLLLGSQWLAAAPVLGILMIGLPARIALNFFDGLAAVAGSMPNMILRHILMCGVIGGGVFLAAPYGMRAVAGLVCGALYLALLLPARAGERRLTGGRLPLLGAMAPGLAIGGGMLALGEFVLVPLANGSQILALLIVLPATALIALLIGLVLPASWLPDALRRRRRALLRLGSREALT
ncbi:oligosaccharide flippase family protein [Polymorphobacter sp.]|uniref:oligosaccharide flippase family protein n=1 Tax=Polymorphobacter sp. TaxID=1909290 RepID=UPI003F71865B